MGNLRTSKRKLHQVQEVQGISYKQHAIILSVMLVTIVLAVFTTVGIVDIM